MSLRKDLMSSIDKVAKATKAKMKPKSKPPVGADSDFGDSSLNAQGKSTPGKPEATSTTPAGKNPFAK